MSDEEIILQLIRKNCDLEKQVEGLNYRIKVWQEIASDKDKEIGRLAEKVNAITAPEQH